jgi:hypothetical protein
VIFRTLEDGQYVATDPEQRLAERASHAARGLEQIGGVSRLTKNELDQINRTLQQGLDAYRALGQQAPKDLQRVADAVTKQRGALETGTKQTGLMGTATGALTSQLLRLAGPAALGAAAMSAISYADSLARLPDVTGISTDALQRLEAIGAASGNTLQQLTGAVTQMQNRLASGDQSAVSAVNQLGLSFTALRQMQPDEQLIAIGKAIAGIQDPAERTARDGRVRAERCRDPAIAALRRRQVGDGVRGDECANDSDVGPGRGCLGCVLAPHEGGGGQRGRGDH